MEDKKNESSKLLIENEEVLRCGCFKFNRVLNVFEARFFLFMMFFIVGITQAYQIAIIMELQEKGCTYSQQAFFSIVLYPYTFKILFAPFMDLFYIRGLGKCKTWTFLTCAMISLLLFVTSPSADERVYPDNIGRLVAMWLTINMAVVSMQITGDIWCVKLFNDPSETGRAAAAITTGQAVGMFFGLNCFIPLNSLAWLNETIFTDNPLTEPIMTHTKLHIFVAVIVLAIGLVALLVVAEKRILHTHNSNHSACKVMKIVPKIFENKNLRMLLFFIGASRIFSSTVMESVLLKLIDNGIKRTTIVNISTYTFPLLLLANYIYMRIMRKGKLMTQCYYLYLLGSILYMSYFWIYFDLKTNGNTDRTKFFLVLYSIGERFQNRFLFLLGFITTITQEEVGATFITFMMCWTNGFDFIPGTIGLRIVGADIINYDIFAFVCLLLEICIIVPLYKSAVYLDSLEKSDFAVLEVATQTHEIDMPYDGHKPGVDGMMLGSGNDVRRGIDRAVELTNMK